MVQETTTTDQGSPGSLKLKKELGLWDVYCIATGAMFSSGFFLLPGLAVMYAGPSAVLAYLLAGLLIVPSMLCMAELATALPRAGGAYYFMDRSLGPAVGAVTGIGTWLALITKSAFALVGMGAYLAVAPGLGQFFSPGTLGTTWLIKVIACGLTILFVAINIFGAKESTRLQSLLVLAILGVMAFFAAEGLWHVAGRLPAGALKDRYTPFLHSREGLGGLVGTIGLVFISYVGLPQIASISEEVRRPERNLPLGMILSLGTATLVYVVGTFIMVAVLGPDRLAGDLTPVATTADELSEWLPNSLGLILVIVAAIAAFASTGNAGILSASRYPFAMARDSLVPSAPGRVGAFRTPTPAILLTGAMTLVIILMMTTEQVAKFGSTFNLLVFGLICLAVIVMRESRIDSYDPGFRVPLYPWTPIAGAAISVWLIGEMGWLTSVVSIGVIVAGSLWYVYYAKNKVDRLGAIHHVFARLGRYRQPELRTEFREIIKEKGLREEDPFDEIVERAEVLELEADEPFEKAVHRMAESLAQRVSMDPQHIAECLLETGGYGGAPVSHGIVLLHFRTAEVEQSELAMARSAEGICVSLPTDDPTQPRQESCDVYGVFALVSPKDKAGQHLRVLAQLAERSEDASFINAWRRIPDVQRLKETLLRDSRFLELFVGKTSATQALVGRSVWEMRLPEGSFPAMVRREGDSFAPDSDTVLREGDHVILIGDPEGIEKLYRRFVQPEEEGE